MTRTLRAQVYLYEFVGGVLVRSECIIENASTLELGERITVSQGGRNVDFYSVEWERKKYYIRGTEVMEVDVA